jgi:hypothetical protein
MSSNATAALVLERLPSGDHAWLRPETTQLDRYRLDPARVVIVDPALAEPKFIPRDQLPRVIVRTTTEYVVFAKTAEQALLWFDLQRDVDGDTEIVTFGKVEPVAQLEPEASAP